MDRPNPSSPCVIGTNVKLTAQLNAGDIKSHTGRKGTGQLATSKENPARGADVLVVGGGLAGCLAALRLAASGSRVIILEAGAQICGNHTWSFHGTDISPENRAWLQPIIVHAWSGQKVIFPRFERRLSTPYASVTSDRLRAVVQETAGIDVREDCPVKALKEDHVVLEDGTVLKAPCVLDCRGFVSSPGLQLGFQKFVGLEVELAEPHGETVPTIMDASVSQRDGYRFVYVLPMSPTRLLIEDTRYSDDGALDTDRVHGDTLEYAKHRGWRVTGTPRSENGILPITLAQDTERFWGAMPADTAPVGLRAGLFHPTTGYSLPMAVDTATLLASMDRPLTTGNARRALEAYAAEKSMKQGFYRLLNRMLFRAAEPDDRYRVMQRFYGLRQPLIERFYAGASPWYDRARILTGKPPVPIQKAIPCVSERRALITERT